MEMTKLLFKWTTSKGRETYGYNICSLWIDGTKQNQTCGGGYDMKGTALGQYINAQFKTELKQLAAKEIEESKKVQPERYYNSSCAGIYGLIYWGQEGKHSLYCDGACGFDAMQSVLKALGYSLEYARTYETSTQSAYIMYKTNS